MKNSEKFVQKIICRCPLCGSGSLYPPENPGSCRNGYDVFKTLAPGADGVMSAQQFMASFVKEGPEGLTQKILEMAAQLKGAMAATGSADIAHISSESLMRI